MKITKEMLTTPKDNFDNDNRFELYSSCPGYRLANRQIASSIIRARRWLIPRIGYARKEGELQKLVYESYKKFIEPVQTKHQKFGAHDTEPRNNIAELFDAFIGNGFYCNL